MEPWGLLDLSIFVLGALYAPLVQQGPVQFALLLAGAIPYFLVWLPIKAFWVRCVLPYDVQPAFARHTGTFEFYAVESMKWCINNLNAATIGKAIFGKPLWLAMYEYRRMRYGIEDLGDTYHVDHITPLYSGYWVRSQARGTKHDLVVLFAPGNCFGFTSAYFYLEYVSLLLVGLQEQGFRNPGIFVVDADFRTVSYKTATTQILAAWESLNADYSASTRVMLGSGVGATSLLAIMLHQAKPLRELPVANAPQPDAAVLISPMPKIAKRRNDSKSDYVCNKHLAKFCLSVIDPEESTSLLTMPGKLTNIEWWSQALPKHGLYLNCGAEEILGSEIEEMYSILKRFDHVSLHSETDQIHAWPIVTAYIARTKVGRNSGIDSVCAQISHMVLWYTSSKSKPHDKP